MATATREKITFEEFCSFVKDGEKADLIDGVIYMASPENFDANQLFMWLGGLLYDYVQARKLGRVTGSRVAYRLDEHNAPEPDIAFVGNRNLKTIRRGYVDGPPDAAFEIVSPESVERDYERKRARYEESGVREYWLIDETEQTVTLLRLDATGKYREVRARKGVLTSKVVKGFWICPEWLWQDPLPEKSAILKQILKGKG
jgi:Uma2 family endonuclease